MKKRNSIPGGWMLDIEDPCCASKDLISCFYKSFEEMTGASYEILLLLGSQVVNGINYKVLCKQTLVTNPSTKHLAVVDIHMSTDGVCTINNIDVII